MPGSKVIRGVSTALAEMSNLKKPIAHFRGVLKATNNAEVKEVYRGSSDSVELFRRIFPAVCASRGVTHISDSNFELWSDDCGHGSVNNQVMIESASKTSKREASAHYNLVTVGGPCAVAAHHLYKASKGTSAIHLQTSRTDSNYDGSAYYVHIRDAMPVYVNPNNRGLRVMYHDGIKRVISSESLANWAVDDPAFVKINLNYMNVLRKPSIVFSIFIPNMFHMVKNLLHRDPENCHVGQVLKHAWATRPITEALAKITGRSQADYVDFDRKTIHVALDDESASDHYKKLSRFGRLPFKEIPNDSCGVMNAKQILDFEECGLLNPRAFEIMEAENVRAARLSKVVVPASKTDPLLLHFDDGNVVSADRVIASLGPSAQWILNGKTEFLKPHMYASGSSSVILALAEEGVDLSFFEIAVGITNTHLTPIDKAVVVDEETGTRYTAYALQLTGGGNFPSRFTTPDIVLSVLSNFRRMFERQGLFFELIQCRSCARAVTATNTISFAQVGGRLGIAYGLGGIGMTTMFPSGEKLLRVVGAERPVDIYEGIDVLQGIDYRGILKSFE